MSPIMKFLLYLFLSLFVVAGAKAEWDGVNGPLLKDTKSR